MLISSHDTGSDRQLLLSTPSFTALKEFYCVKGTFTPVYNRRYYKKAMKTRAELADAKSKYQGTLRSKAQGCREHLDELSACRETKRQLRERRDEVNTLTGKIKELQLALNHERVASGLGRRCASLIRGVSVARRHKYR